MRYIAKKMSLIMSLVVVMVSTCSLTAFGASAPCSWSDVPTLLWDDDSEVFVSSPTQTEQPEILGAASETEEVFASLSSIVYEDYDQPLFHVKDGYDAISFFVTKDDDRTTYEGKCFFIISGNQWMLYNYTPETAGLYFDKVDDFNGLKVPSVKASTRSDNPTTASVNEAKIPVMSRASFNGIYCNWRTFEDIPFTRDSNGKLVYATYATSETPETPDDPADDDNPADPTPNPGSGDKPADPTTPSANTPSSVSGNWYRYTVTMDSGNVYRVFVTRSVSYNGKKHVLFKEGKTSKKKSYDVKVYVYLNGQLVDPKLYKVTFKNNKNVNGYAGKEKVTPYVRLKFKFKNKALKADKKAIRKKGFGFNITPLDLTSGEITTKGTSFYFNTPQGASIKMIYKKDEKKGDYQLYYQSQTDDLILEGKNNFKGRVILTLDSFTQKKHKTGDRYIY